MRIAIVGTRGIPANYGGFETFAFHLSLGLAESGIHVTIVNEHTHRCEQTASPLIEIRYSKYNKSKNPLQFYRNSIRMTENDHDVVLVCGVGGAFFYQGKSRKALMVTNVDGLEHLRHKYTYLQRKLVYFLQSAAQRCSDYLIADSEAVKSYWINRFPERVSRISAIAYGADLIDKANDSPLSDYGLKANDYWLVIARLVPENNIEMLIKGYQCSETKMKLFILGDVNDNEYAKRISKMASDKIIFPGPIYDEKIVQSLRFHAFAYLHGHSVGGTNPSLVEAMAAGCACICFRTVFNDEVTKGEQLAFGNDEELSVEMKKIEKNNLLRSKMKSDAFAHARDVYSWKNITTSYTALFNKLLRERK